MECIHCGKEIKNIKYAEERAKIGGIWEKVCDSCLDKIKEGRTEEIQEVIKQK